MKLFKLTLTAPPPPAVEDLKKVIQILKFRRNKYRIEKEI
jgi:hypothetical protein